MFTEINSFPELCAESNIPGVASFEFIESSSVLTMPDFISDINRLSDSVELKPGKQWLLAYAVIDTLRLKENHRGSDDGDLFQFSITGKAKQHNPTASALFGRMIQTTYLLRIRMKSGDEIVLGTPTVPLTMTYKLDSDNKLYEFEFSGVSKWPMPFKAE